MADRKVTLYTVDSQTVVVRDLDNITFHSVAQDRGPLGERFTPIGATYTETNVPIHEIRRDGKCTEWIALHPQLKAILDLPYHERLFQAQVDAEMVRRLTYTMGRFESRIKSFNNAPWWKRVVIALKGGV